MKRFFLIAALLRAGWCANGRIGNDQGEPTRVAAPWSLSWSAVLAQPDGTWVFVSPRNARAMPST